VSPNLLVEEFFLKQLLIQGYGNRVGPFTQPCDTSFEELKAKLRKHLIYDFMGFPIGFRSSTFVYILPGANTFVTFFHGLHYVHSLSIKENPRTSSHKKIIRFRKFSMSSVERCGKDLEIYLLPRGSTKKRSKAERTFKGCYITKYFPFHSYCSNLRRILVPAPDLRPFVRSVCLDPDLPGAFSPQSGEEPSNVDASDQPSQPSNDIQKPELSEGNPQVPVAPGSQCQSVNSGFRGTTLPPNYCRGAYFISQPK
jgi:hypothetical protein